MKKNKATVYLFLALFCVWLPAFVGFRYSQQIRNVLPAVFVQVFDSSKPAASTSLRNSQPQILTNWSDLQTALNQDHEFVDASSGQQSGEHTQVKFLAPISTPSNAANKGWLYSKDVSAVVELHWEDESGNELQFTSGGDLFSSTNLVVTGTSTFNGSITLSAGNDLLLSTTSDITISGNTFTVAGATGNTVIGGTLTVTGVATLGDTSALATSGAPAADAQIANKKYVDDQVAAEASGYAKGWAYVDTDGTNLASYNVSGVVRNGTGDYTVSWDTDFGSANYAVAISNYNAPGEVAIATIVTQAAGTIQLNTYKNFETATKADVKFSVIAFGAQ